MEWKCDVRKFKVWSVKFTRQLKVNPEHKKMSICLKWENLSLSLSPFSLSLFPASSRQTVLSITCHSVQCTAQFDAKAVLPTKMVLEMQNFSVRKKYNGKISNS